jgi:ELWxxDGT repeat protein
MENDRTSAELVPGSGKVVFVDNYSLYYGDRKTGETIKLKTFPYPTGYETGKVAPYDMVAMNGIVYFGAGDGVSGTELWRSDGTVAGTRLVKDIQPVTYRPDDQLKIEDSNPEQLTVAGGHLYFAATTFDKGKELWTSDGTGAGTHIVANLASGGTDSYGYETSSSPTLLAVNGGKLFFAASGTTNIGLFTLDPAAGDKIQFIVDALPQKALVAQSRIFFLTQDNNLDGLIWSSDGTPAGTVQVHSGKFMQLGPVIDGTAYFTAWEQSIQQDRLWHSDGTVNGTHSTSALPNNPDGMVAFGGKIYYRDSDGETIRSYRPSDGAIRTVTTEPGSGAMGAAIGEFFFVSGGGVDVLDPTIGAITGTIYNDADGDGTKDAGESGLVGYRVFIDRNNDGICNRNEPQTRSSSTGRYRFELLPEGSYRIRVTPVDGRRFTPADSFNARVTGGATTIRYFGSTTLALFAGSVFLDANSDGVPDSAHSGLAGWRAFIDLDGDGGWDSDEPSAMTNAAGRFYIAQTAGRYSLRIQPLSGYTATIPSSGRRTITVATGEIASARFGERRLT